jgi:hypothetical protein
MIKLRIERNIFGNWRAYESGRFVRALGDSEFLAIDWVSTRLAVGDCVLSTSSDLTMTQVREHRQRNGIDSETGL